MICYSFAQAFVAPFAWGCCFVVPLDRCHCYFVLLLLEAVVVFLLLNMLLCSFCFTCYLAPLTWCRCSFCLTCYGALLAQPTILLLLFDPLPLLLHTVALLLLLDTTTLLVQHCCSLLIQVPFLLCLWFCCSHFFCSTLLFLLLLFQISTLPTPPFYFFVGVEELSKFEFFKRDLKSENSFFSIFFCCLVF
jgi:hypothetical protein